MPGERGASREEAFELVIPVRDSDIDELGHVNNVVYLRWVQEVAIAHWQATATADEQAAVAWVVVRHEIDYEHPALPGDDVLARTWVGAATALRFERHTELLRAADRRRLARARTLWCPIDVRTGRPMHVPPDVRERFSVQPDAEPKR